MKLVRNLLPLLLLTACVEGLNVAEEEQEIINGVPCEDGESPQTVALVFQGEINFGGGGQPVTALMCTGTLIAPDVVLTAAHCLKPELLTGGFGTVENPRYFISHQHDLRALNPQQQSAPPLPDDARPAREVLAHPSFSLEGDFQPGLGNLSDIGLMFLEEAVTDIVPAIVLTPDEEAQIEVGEMVTIAGWGQQAAPQNSPGGTKHCANAQVFEIAEFEMQIGDTPDTARKCHGDSGGPTYAVIEAESDVKARVIGATSRAYDQSDCEKGGIDTFVSGFYEWIDSEMQARCDNDTRVWCEEPGVIPPSFYDDGNTGGGSDAGIGGGDDGGSEDSGCGCSTQSGSRGGSLAFIFLALVALRRRKSAGNQ